MIRQPPHRALIFSTGISFVVLGLIFTLVPEFLEHSPVGFEKRGIVHHIFHYLILIGGFTLVIGFLFRDQSLEILGLVACILPVTLNMFAHLTISNDPAEISGFDVAIRVIIIYCMTMQLVYLHRED